MITPYSVHRASQMFINTLNNTDVYYDALSALQKSIRASDPDGTVFYLEALLETGADPLLICRRLMVIAAEDVGLGNPNGLIMAATTLRVVETLGFDDSKNALAELGIYLANSPKDNSAMCAQGAAASMVQE